MLEQLKYKNHLNEVFEFGKDGIYVNTGDLRDYEWSVSTKGRRISSFDYSVGKKKLPVVIVCDTEAQGIEARNKLFEVVEKDVLARKHGQIIVGDYYLKGFVTASKKSNYLLQKRLMEAELTISTDFPYWVKETTTPYSMVGAAATIGESGEFLDYPIPFPHDYYCDLNTKPLVNSNFVASNFRLIIYGTCVNPTISIADHIYQVNCTVEANEYLTIDSATKKIFITGNDGTVRNVFNLRNRASYVFEKIPTGSNVVSWNGNFAFDIVLLEERSEPKWT